MNLVIVELTWNHHSKQCIWLLCYYNDKIMYRQGGYGRPGKHLIHGEGGGGGGGGKLAKHRLRLWYHAWIVE